MSRYNKYCMKKPLIHFWVFVALLFVLSSCGMQARDDELSLLPVVECRPCDPCFEKDYFAQDNSVDPGPLGTGTATEKNTVAGLDTYALDAGCTSFRAFQFHGVASGSGLQDITWTAAGYNAPSSKQELMGLIVDALNTTGTACYSLVDISGEPKIRAEFRSGDAFGINIMERFLDCGEVSGTDGWSYGLSADNTAAYNCTGAGDDVANPYDGGNCEPTSSVISGSL